ncbi:MULTISPECIES: type II toxin-antitoxin system PemK/MazF family toxin [unclassified Nocardioides]|uniref:type II toxin-antitoxin system PemK/MazF family toxin n=1 Tax=unclassified Nocardioides TaxID=2615069 RepID=UPI003623FD2D
MSPVARSPFPVSYAPKADGRPDPGEVVWGWVPYEDDPSRGKDRPVLLVGVQGRELLGLMLTSKDHDRDAEQEARWGRHWMDVGSGGWDRSRRPSEVRLDRLIRLEADAVRREGAALDPAVFARVIDAARSHHAFD